MLIWIEQPLLINKGMVYLIIIIKTSLIKLINILSAWTLVNVNETATNVSFPILVSSFDEVKGKGVVELYEYIDILLSVWTL